MAAKCGTEIVSTSTDDDITSNVQTEQDEGQLQVLTFAMTIEYNGFHYAGFQRQSPTPRIDIHPTCEKSTPDTIETSTSLIPSNATASHNIGNSNGSCRKRKKCYSQQGSSSSTQQPLKKKIKNRSSTPITIQDQIESALQKWTNLSIATLRVRGAGRTDKGVNASGQVVAFDVPLNLLHATENGGEQDKGDGGVTGDRRARYNDTLSEQSVPLLREAFSILQEYKSNKNNDDDEVGDVIRKTMADQWQIRRAITTRLPRDIVLRSVRIWTGSQPFEPRYEISCKTYVYNLRFRRMFHSSNQNGESTEVHPICNAGPHLLRRIYDQNSVWLSPWALDPTLLRQACKEFVGRHDFFNFVHKRERAKCPENDCNDKPPNEVDLFEFKVDMQQEEHEEEAQLPVVINATFCLKAKGFKRCMVRNLVGFVVDVARGLRSVDDASVLLMEKDGEELKTRSDHKTLASLVNCAPACGLFLAKVEYTHDNFL
mmetsp:Transcript_25275/g.53396  ORF Transcript_25275/g.53396 Transcript_25275/m.53396 type:complete len:485 (+) Transcript_25275:176-1630(+)|eukprot:CAMPEP_0183707876 /NCGR_PEP_ID=MMETSP0737-20130205/4304_1 /TAXON_ID=385413 /ORGANISM="Thalassiosira miniscula, Strain CCMP1093" /LENGTH=484 /DNA_ID=CAMNT_0025935609 /DNA_START=80 /DNA_END=1534 /DNA_ORIENTATION=+